MKLHHVRLGVSLAVAVTLLCACGDAKTDASGNAAVAKVIANPEEAAKVLLLGTGATCDDDRGCESQGVASACVLGTCFGLLTTDTPAARAVLVDRIGNAPPELRNALSVLLQRAVVSGDAKTRARVAAVEGLGAIAAGDKGECGESCTALRLLRKSTDPQIAAAARLALAAVGQPDVLKDVVDDLQQGADRFVKPLTGPVFFCFGPKFIDLLFRRGTSQDQKTHTDGNDNALHTRLVFV